MCLVCFLSRRFYSGRAFGTGQDGDPQMGLRTPFEVAPFEIPLLKPLLCQPEVFMLRADIYKPGRPYM